MMLDALAETHVMRKGMEGMCSDVVSLNSQQQKTNTELVKVNLQPRENTRAIL